MIRPHIHTKPARPGDLLQLARRARSASEIVEAADDFQHGGQGDLAGVAAEAGVRAVAVVQVRVEGSVEADGFRIGEVGGFAVGLDLRCLEERGSAMLFLLINGGMFSEHMGRVGEGGTDKATEDLVTWLDADFAPVVVDGVVDLGFSIGAESAVETDAFHGVVQDLVVGFGRVHLGVLVDGREMLLSLFGKVVI